MLIFILCAKFALLQASICTLHTLKYTQTLTGQSNFPKALKPNSTSSYAAISVILIMLRKLKFIYFCINLNNQRRLEKTLWELM